MWPSSPWLGASPSWAGGLTSRVWIPNSPSRRRSSVLNSTAGPGQQVVAAAARVLEQVAGELLLERALVALQLAAVLLGEVDGVLVGDVDAGDPGGLVGVHLLGQLAGEFDRLHLGAEGAAEDPLDEAFDATLEVA